MEEVSEQVAGGVGVELKIWGDVPEEVRWRGGGREGHLGGVEVRVKHFFFVWGGQNSHREYT